MPLYDFECEPCAYYTEIRQPMSEPSFLECPICGQETLKKVFINAPQAFVRGEPTSIGQLAERNWDNMGYYEKTDRTIKDQIKKGGMTDEQKEKRNQHQKIMSMTPDQQMKWVREGD
ncbi:uncharacterized protein METZ01_LOCUS134155 [marine metagenome]|jgi:putative FmdB family regulatory protein|uniref:Putative regulatory protein FmdB zinc ribbon domain-containing protein n=1 Tax=marine metagenome TaxID=408172 RepID=A0A381YXF6_9ZZZZ